MYMHTLIRNPTSCVDEAGFSKIDISKSRGSNFIERGIGRYKSLRESRCDSGPDIGVKKLNEKKESSRSDGGCVPVRFGAL